MYSVTKTIPFEAGHRLMSHKGKCHNLHGHNYVAEITITRNELDKNGMVIDFFDVKTFTNEFLKQWDHTMILNSSDADNIAHCKKHQYKLYTIDAEPTAENMAKIIYDYINRKIDKSILTKVSVTIYETPDCKATFTDENIS